MVAKKCPLCGGKPRFFYYAPNKKAQDVWECGEDGEPEPLILFKVLECSDCHARPGVLSMICDEAVAIWNEKVGAGMLMIPYGDEPVEEVES